MKTRLLLAAILLFCTKALTAQYTQQLRGTVTDQVLSKPLAGATVNLQGTKRSTVTDEEGNFRFNELPIGSYGIIVSFAGFREITLENIAVNSGKETVIQVRMETLVHTESEFVVRASSKKNRPLNDMSLVSARAFTVEETQRYAASVNDPLRMATAFPGVFAADDGNNHIVIRGNSPTGLLWKMEGMDIPNPNHFSNAGSSGGGISILSSTLLANSDFLTGAFAAEYGNALSGVFDLRLRKGNNERTEYTLQAGLLGLNAAVEGPFSKSYKGSFLVNYRYSTLELLNKVGVLNDESSTNFQDLSYQFYLPTQKLGTFTFFGFGGLSSETRKSVADSSAWKEKSDRYPYDFLANTGMTGLTHTILAGNRMNIRTGVGLSYTRHGFDEDYIEDDYAVAVNHRERYTTRKINFNTTLNYRWSNRLHLRAGAIAQLLRYNFYQLSGEHEGDPLVERINAGGNTSTQQLFAQGQLKLNDQFTLNAGMHFLRLSLNGSTSLEPRVSARWQVSPRSSIGIGYGLHSQLQALGVYFAQEPEAGGGYQLPNRGLGFTRSHHYVFSFSHRLSPSLLIKAEAYYQHLFDVPVSLKDSSTFSTLNIQDDYVIDPLSNTGSGRNYGIELSIERYLSDEFYFSLTNSIYQSKYTARDGIERNTRFNGNHISTLIAGKEFRSFKRPITFGVNVKLIYAGGMRTTPIDLGKSQEKGYAVFIEDQAFSLQNPAYFRADLRVGLTWNKRKHTSTLSLDIQNLTNRQNIFNQGFDEEKNVIVNNYQTGLIPVLNYKIEF